MTPLDLTLTLWRSLADGLDAFGTLGMAFGFAASLMPSRRLILLAAAGAGLCFSAHYAHMGSLTATGMSLLGVTQNLLAARFGSDARRPAWMLPAFGAMAILAMAATLATWNGTPSSFACAGALLSTCARLQLRQRRMRWCFLASSSCWVVHNALIGSVCAITCDLLTMLGFAIALLRVGGDERDPRRDALAGLVPEGALASGSAGMTLAAEGR